MPRSNRYPKLTTCQNCETPTPGNYCPECGQDCRDHRVAIRLLVVGLWNDLFTFDNRFWRSFVVLLAKPGELTLRYMGGKRVRYIPPVRMYLFVSIIFFFILSAVASNSDNIVTQDEIEGREQAAAVMDSLAVEVAAIPDFVDGVVEGLANDAEYAGETAGDHARTGDDDLVDGTMFGRAFELDKDTLVSTMFSLAPKGMFLLLPAFAALLALIYRRSRRMYVEHLIFSLHYHTLLFILFTLSIVVSWGWFQLAVLLGFNVYLYLAMKRVYEQGWRKTWLKHFLLTGAYNVVLMAFLVAVTAGSIMLASWATEHPRWLGWLT